MRGWKQIQEDDFRGRYLARDGQTLRSHIYGTAELAYSFAKELLSLTSDLK